MATGKKFYWLKLQKDFFKRHDIRVIEDMPNGKDYILFYLKLLVESISHEGELRFNESIPYNEQMLSSITNTNIDIVRSAIKLFTELQLMEVLDDRTIYMTETTKMLGYETDWAKQKRKQRKKNQMVIEKTSGLISKDNLKTKKDIVHQEKEIDIELDKDKDKKKIIKENIVYFADAYLNEVFEDFIDERKKRKQPMSERAITIMVNKINNLNDNEYAVDLLQESIMNGWKGIFPKNKPKQKGRYDVLMGDDW